jgi:tRNA (guanine-N7-)-methyltransferase
LPLEKMQPYLVDMPTPERPLVWAGLFATDRPVELEVGFGKGLFLLTAAEHHPEINYLGIEIERKYQLHTATRLTKRNLTNVKLLCGDARAFLRDSVPVAALQALHVYFPDPWWKHRHKKRRVFTAEFAEQAARVIRPGGRLHLATDVEEYYHVMQGLVAQQPELVPIPVPTPAEGEPKALTNFERKYRLEGRPIYRALYERAAAHSGRMKPLL